MSVKTQLGVGDVDTNLDEGSLDTVHAEGHHAARGGDEPVRGETIGRFVILDVLGSGGMGVVYAAYDPQLDRRVAIKLLKASLRGADAGTRLLREAQAMAKINHPSVIKVHDVGTFRDQVYIAMEHADGGTLRAWLDKDRSIADILDVFGQAGRGLAAAHAAGLVHRDFKPDNVLMVGDGSVRVTDFGLVGLADGAPPTEPVALSGRITPLSTELTRTGALMGTPSYMAPEQFSGSAVTEAVDQFAFCVALYEALYKQRPFAGTSVLELSAHVALGEITVPVARSRVPGWLRKVVVRGLAVEPGDRYPSMLALVAALSRDPRRRRWQVVAGAGIVAAAIGGYALSATSGNDAGPCRGGDDKIATVWSPQRRAAIASAFARSTRAHAPATLAKLVPMLDAWSSRWQLGYTDACEATHVRAEQSEHLMDLRMQCLTRRLDDANATINLLAAGGDDAIDHALDAARALPALDACADATALTADVALPTDPLTSERVAAVRARLDDARGQYRLGRYDASRTTARQALADAKASGYAPVSAEAMLVLGRAEYELADKASIAHLRDAMHAATEVGDDATTIAAATTLVRALFTQVSQYDVAREVAQNAEAVARHAHVAPKPMADLDNAIGALDLKQGNNTDAQARFEAALALADKLPADDPAQVSARSGLANLANRLGHYEDAVGQFERLAAQAERVFGATHPRYANALNELAIAYRNAARLDDAKRANDRALAIRIAALGPDHPDVGSSYNSIGNFYLEQADGRSAQTYFEKALAIWEKVYGPSSVEITPALANLGNAVMDQGDYAKARQIYDRALALEEAAYGADDPRVAYTVSNLGTVAQDEGKLDEALALFQRAEKIAEKAYGPDHPDVADYLLNISTIYKQQKKLPEAAAIHRQVLEVVKKAYGTDHPRVAMALANYGNVQMEQDDFKGALDSYQKSLAIFDAKLKPDHPYTSYALLGVGGALIELDRRTEAVPILERALAIRIAGKMSPELVAESRYALARALDKGPRAIELAREALADYDKAGNTDSVAQVKIWLAKRT